MATSQELAHPRKISSIDEELVVSGSSDGGTSTGVIRTDALFALLSGGTSKTIQTAKIDIATAADNEIIAATAGQKIHVVSLTFTMSAENDITLKDGATAISGAMPFGGTSEPKGATFNLNPFPLVMTVNTAFNITLSQSQQVSGFCQFYKE